MKYSSVQKNLSLQKNKTMGVADMLFKRKKEQAEKNLNDGLAFLAENAKREEVVTLPSGLQYEIMTEGSGAKPKAKDTVKCHYHGTNIKGQVFDSSVKRGTPASFPLNRVISGWTEALQLMPVGSKWKLFLPANLAYGEEQISKEIGPNSTLIFEVELLGIK
ncbi:FKBP-type peptidyl-prolyl cis-trans isomerase [Chryseobacterium sp.]|uniref:FKBP-type peptidyl-prolyl cis-trans isomerase n=1 Tax=Chryseobacterium sp. TaxID=1871047 RepID=UPI00388FA620